ncbi:MAG: 2,3-bisphosphoglycerate-independent phosphoglycerate mutase [Candidatus Falkowbacteria bacterium]|nr:2,3-bisphosphoglycerate-independent phosphoglycerate mutase [Candidatus Falkowbacteria bacterium]
MKSKQPVILIIRDGWGYNSGQENNPIAQAHTPNEDSYLSKFPNGLLATSGEAVGLSEGYQGNSEVGHLTMGAGRIIFQPLTRIDKAIATGDFFKNPAFLGVIKNCQTNKTKLHLIGLLQDQGVHSHINHLFALLDLCKQQNFHDVLIHVITDGRDAPVTESIQHLEKLQSKLAVLGFGKVVTISSRYYTMDRDNRWERTEKAYDTIVLGQGPEFNDPITEVKACHQNKEFDEFIQPRRVTDYNGFAANDGVIFFNFRTDRPRQLTKAIIDQDFVGFNRQIIPIEYVTMTQYYEPSTAIVAFSNISLNNLLGQVVSAAGFCQLRISETEKYPHVTFFFNGQVEEPSAGEDRVMIPSPKVATYDLQPEMSVFEIANRLIVEIERDIYDLIIVNLVNSDMVGHTGNIPAIISAIEAVDQAQGQIINAALTKNYVCLVLADHGNAEDKNAATQTSHTTHPVPVILISNNQELNQRKIITGGGLKDVAPTILQLLGLAQPEEMSGKCLF